MTPRSTQHGGARTDRPAGEEAAPPDAPTTPDEALTLAREHARVALAEALRVLRCLLEAAALAAGSDALDDPRRGLGRIRRVLEAAAETLEQEDGRGDLRLLDAVAQALDAEIARWEERGRDDAEARAVLRAFLGLREILWDLGVRPAGARPGKPRSDRDDRASRGAARGGAPPVERVPIED